MSIKEAIDILEKERLCRSSQDVCSGCELEVGFDQLTEALETVLPLLEKALLMADDEEEETVLKED